ncbi:MAG: hypothetical protein IIB40_02765 [Candidatus Marinimicrobia bacterium]|nr:hypothetical protein [Candidatus Neomarinimicrobiota bacterium]MCH7954320.1 hypothetical protein [Candidatus Neomarinimicrobiota bacterium]
MIELIMGVIVLLVGGLLLQPILNKKQLFNIGRDDKEIAVSELQREKRALFREIKDIELDFHMGKISESDFDELTTSYREKAMEKMKHLESLNGEKKQPVLQPEYNVPEAEQAGYCQECGSALFRKAGFCGVCGHKV